MHLLRYLAGALAFALVVALLPHRWCARDAQRWYRGDRGLQNATARSVSDWVDSELRREQFDTGSGRFDSEWLYGTYMMAAMGFGQLAAQQPASAALNLRRMERCLDRALEPAGHAFDSEAWRESPLTSLDGDNGHAAFLGYTNLALGLHRQLDPASKYAALNDSITAALVRRVEASPTLLIPTYPNEIYPVDNAAVIASIGTHARATGAEAHPLVARWSRRAEQRYVDPRTGLLYQAVRGDGRPLDAPRGSGTALAAYFLSFADTKLSRKLHLAVQRELARSVLGFGVVREYPAGVAGGLGDIDSGPLIAGFSISATGFALAGCRIHGDPQCFSRLYSTIHLMGAPVERGGKRSYVSGGPLSDAIMLAMQTARRAP